ncbi:MAG TPA: cytochrome c [Pyrinomonadaceae bacterium]|nr:cytochrome c [Pyrinomonadaceae bacterium]
MKLLKIIAVALITLPLLLTAVLNSSATASAARDDFDAAAVFKAKCAMCHGQKAEKKFDPTKADDDLVNIVLKSEKPGMPAYETKGINVEQARAIVAHMKSLRQ